MLHVGVKATTDQELGEEYDCYTTAMLAGKTVVGLFVGG